MQAGYEQGIMDENEVQNKIDMKREEIIRLHEEKHKISQGKGSDKRWFTRLPDGSSKGKLVKRKNLQDLHTLIVQFYCIQEQKDTHTLRSLYPDLMEQKKLEKVADTTILRYQVVWNKFFENDTEIVDMDITKITRGVLKNWILQLLNDNPMDRKGYNNIKTLINQIFGLAFDREYIQNNYYKDIRIPTNCFTYTNKEVEEDIFSKEEMQKLVSYLWNLYEQNTQYTVPLALLFDFATGLRPGELVALKFSDIDSDNMLHIQRQAVKKRSADGKLDRFKIVDHAKSRSRNKPVYLSQDALFILNLAKEANEKNGDTQEGFIFYNNHKQLPASTATSCLRKACKGVGIPVRGLYRIRKTYASLLIDLGVNPPMVTTAMGHSSIDITYRHYVRDISSRSETAIAIERALNGRVTPSNTKLLQKIHNKNAPKTA